MVIQASPPGYPGSGVSVYGTPIAIPAARPYTVPAGNWMILCGAGDFAQMAINGTTTKQFYAAAIAIPFITSDGANVTIAGGVGTTIIPIQQSMPVQGSPPGFPGSGLSPYGMPITIPAARPYTLPAGVWIVFLGAGDHVNMQVAAADNEQITIAGAVGEAIIISDGTNVTITGGAGTTIVPITSAANSVQASPASFPGSGLSTFGALITVPAPRPYTIPKGNFIVLMGVGDNAFMQVDATHNVQISVTGIDLTYLVSDGANLTLNGGSGSRLIPVY